MFRLTRFAGVARCEWTDELPAPPQVFRRNSDAGYMAIRHRWPQDEAGMQGVPKRAWPDEQPEASEIPRLERALKRCVGKCESERFVLATALLGASDPRGVDLYRAGDDPDSLCALGQCYQFGTGVDQDDDKAVEYYRRAADAGHPHALYSLGALYYVGDGALQEDETQAVKYFARAAAALHPAACYLLGDCILEGTAGLEPDRDAALRWLVAAGDRGHRGARSRVFALVNPQSCVDADQDWDRQFTDASRQTLRRRKTQQK